MSASRAARPVIAAADLVLHIAPLARTSPPLLLLLGRVRRVRAHQATGRSARRRCRDVRSQRSPRPKAR